jgi:hypothetical protein
MSPIWKRGLIVVLLAISLATPRAILQSAAWVRMVVKYCQTTSLSQALAMTFDGKHPCRLCRFIQHHSDQDQKPQPQTVQMDEQWQLGLPPEMSFVFYPPPAWGLGQVQDLPSTWREPPPTPPPRIA